MKQLQLLRYLPLLALLLIVGTVITSSTLQAYASEEESYQHVYDKAGLLSTDEVAELEQKCIDYGTDAGIDIMILTHDDPKAAYAEDYIEDFHDQQSSEDQVYLLVDMANRNIYMEGYGKAETYIHSKRINALIDEIKPDLGDGAYFEAFSIYIERSAAYMKDDSELNYDHNYNAENAQTSDPNAPYYDATNHPASTNDKVKSVLTSVWFQLLAALVIGIITVSVMAINSGGRMTAGSSTYIDQNQSGLIGRRDDYIRTQVTRVKKPENNNNNNSSGGFNSGGFQGGVSDGGSSHSSGGSSF